MATKKKKTTTKNVQKKKIGKKVVTTTTTVVVEEEAAVLTNHVAFVLDISYSMQSCFKEAIRQLNRQFDLQKQESAKYKQNTTVSLFVFGGNGDYRVRSIFLGVPVQSVRYVSASEFQLGDNTPLRDGYGFAIQEMGRFVDAYDKSTSFLVIGITDGGENSSYLWSASKLRDKIKQTVNSDRWTHTFLVPHGGREEIESYGVPPGNITEWENDVFGASVAGGAMASGNQNFYSARSNGSLSVSNFYVQPDLSSLTKTQVKKNLADLSTHFKSFEVTSESEVRDFVQKKTKKPYVIGSAYYQLMKTEKKVQPTKNILLRDKTTGAVYGGPEARALIGLPATANATVEPGNHANYDIFIESTSTNRILPRGTKVLVDYKQAVNKTPTWV
jgi:hypothetical protein